MKKHHPCRSTVAIFLTLCLILPDGVFGAGKSGKKYFKEGVKYESVEQWDRAAEQYALAVSEEPGNAEFRLRLLRATQMASLMFAARGDLLEAKTDYDGAYNAYARAFAYDQTNEMARIKMARMLEQQRAKAGLGVEARYNPRNGNLRPISNEIQTPQRPVRGDVMQKIDFSEGTSLKLVILNLARQLNLNVIFDESFKDNNKFSLSLNDVTLPRALDLVLLQNKLIFEQADRRTIVIYADIPANRQRLEKLMVKTFYLSNAEPNEMRALVQANLGAQRQVNISKQLNALVVRATASELAVAQSLIDSLDKNRSEVVLDVNIYEVSNSTSLAIGNQLATAGLATTKTTYDTNGNPVTVTTGASSSLGDLGGIGRAGVSAIAGNLFGVGGGIGTVLGLPPSSLSLLQSKGASKLLASTQVHGLDGEQNQTVVGRSVPIRTGTGFLNGGGSIATTTNANNGSGYTVDNIQYRDVGLVIDVTPTITNEGYVQVKMKLESSNVEASGTDSTLTPSFTKRSLTTISRVQDGLTAVVACVKQDSKGDSRVTIPVVGMVPILGRLFTTPKQTSSQSDIVITVTPHIIRPSEIKMDDHLARFSGTQLSGVSQSVDDVIFRAQVEEDQERRAVAQQSLTSPLGPVVEASLNQPASEAPRSASPATIAPRSEIIRVSQPVAPSPSAPGAVAPATPQARRSQ